MRRYKGSVYQAANWIPVGETKGYARSNGKYTNKHGVKKKMLVYPLQAETRALLRDPQERAEWNCEAVRVQYSQAELASLRELLEEVPDARKARGLRHPLGAVLALLVLAKLAGRHGGRAAEKFCKQLPQRDLRVLLCRFNALLRRYEAPSDTTFQRALAEVEAGTLERVIQRWTQPRCGRKPRALAGDGKRIRGANRMAAEGLHWETVTLVDHAPSAARDAPHEDEQARRGDRGSAVRDHVAAARAGRGAAAADAAPRALAGGELQSLLAGHDVPRGRQPHAHGACAGEQRGAEQPGAGDRGAAAGAGRDGARDADTCSATYSARIYSAATRDTDPDLPASGRRLRRVPEPGSFHRHLHRRRTGAVRHGLGACRENSSRRTSNRGLLPSRREAMRGGQGALPERPFRSHALGQGPLQGTEGPGPRRFAGRAARPCRPTAGQPVSAMATSSATASACVTKKFRAADTPIGSGGLEATCKSVVTERLKRVGTK